jgi:hypothetical protein
MTTLALAPYARLQLVSGAVAVPALISHLSPGLVLPEKETRDVVAAARSAIMAAGGALTANVSGVQVWSSAAAETEGGTGSPTHLGSVDWTFDTPGPGFATVFRVIVTAAGVQAGHSTATILHPVLAAAGVSIDAERLGSARAPTRDPFRAKRAT